MDCRRAEELLSEHLEGALPEPFARELEAHLASCPACAELRDALREVIEALRSFPSLEPAHDLAERAAARALFASRAGRPRRAPAPTLRLPFVMPAWVQAAAAGLLLVITGTLLLVAGPEGPTRVAARLVDRTVDGGTYLLERSDRLVEDVRILGVVIATAFEGRLDRVNDRMDDYRKRLERRRDADDDAKKTESGLPAPEVLSAGTTASPPGPPGFRTAPPRGA